ncbi:ABC transporter permease [Puia sp.]|jgi:lipopolysaccharide transport system permease protein|uniref:ABC transporter permease n=1 Tax=Puia sp. TaxID=2045100 RepID=UPI002F3E7600
MEITTPGEENWDMVIEARSNLFQLRLRDVWHYRDLLVLLVRRDFVSFYKQTVLGPIWFFVQPLITTLTYTLVFGRLAGIKTDNLPAPLFYMAGIMAWNYFSECLVKTSTVFRDNAHIFGKVYFPRLIMPLSIVISNLVRFAVQALLFFGMMAFFAIKGDHFHVTAYALLFPVLVFQMALLGLGTGMIVSAMTNRYRDLALLIAFATQLLMYSTTVVYPLSKVPSSIRWLIEANPLTSSIEALRLGFLGAGTFSWGSFGIGLVVTFVLALFGIVIFNKVERNFIDTV